MSAHFSFSVEDRNKLIELVRAEPIIWDKVLTYGLKGVKGMQDKAWDQICIQMDPTFRHKREKTRQKIKERYKCIWRSHEVQRRRKEKKEKEKIDEEKRIHERAVSLLKNALATPVVTRNAESTEMNVGPTTETPSENNVLLETTNPQVRGITLDEHNTPSVSNNNNLHGSAFWANQNIVSPINTEPNLLSSADVPHCSVSADHQNVYLPTKFKLKNNESINLQKPQQGKVNLDMLSTPSTSSANILHIRNSVPLQNLDTATNPDKKINECSNMANVQPHRNASVAHRTPSKTTVAKASKPNKTKRIKTKLIKSKHIGRSIQNRNLTKKRKLQVNQRSNMPKKQKVRINSELYRTPSTAAANDVQVTNSDSFQRGGTPTKPAINKDGGLNRTQVDNNVSVKHRTPTKPHANPSHKNPSMNYQNRNPAHYEMAANPQANRPSQIPSTLKKQSVSSPQNVSHSCRDSNNELTERYNIKPSRTMVVGPIPHVNTSVTSKIGTSEQNRGFQNKDHFELAKNPQAISQPPYWHFQPLTFYSFDNNEGSGQKFTLQNNEHLKKATNSQANTRTKKGKGPSIGRVNMSQGSLKDEHADRLTKETAKRNTMNWINTAFETFEASQLVQLEAKVSKLVNEMR